MTLFHSGIIRCLVISMLVSIHALANANPQPRYQIEVILFKRMNASQSLASSQTTPYVLSEPHRLLIDQDQADSEDQSFVKCRQNQFALAKEDYAISQQSHLQILEHIAWHANADELNRSSPIAIFTNTSLMANSHEIPELQGTISIKKDANFHITTDFSFATSKSNSDPTVIFFAQQGDYVMRENELHYFDGERLGILMKIIKL